MIVLSSIAAGLVLGLLFVLAVFGGGTEAQITGSALVALGAGFVILASPRELRANRNEFLELPTVFEQAKAVKSLGSKPLAVLSADQDQQRGWATAQEELARLSSNSVHKTAQGATHSALLEDERFASITTRAITDIVRAARSGQPLR